MLVVDGSGCERRQQIQLRIRVRSLYRVHVKVNGLTQVIEALFREAGYERNGAAHPVAFSRIYHSACFFEIKVLVDHLLHAG